MGRVKRINTRSFFVIFDLVEFPFKFTMTQEIFVPIRLGTHCLWHIQWIDSCIVLCSVILN